MTHPTTLCMAILAGLGLSLGTAAQAQDAPSYTYFGLSAGQSHSQLDEGASTNSVTGSSAGLQNFEHQDTAYKIFGGYQFNRSVAVEAGYFNLGKFGYSAGSGLSTLRGQYEVDGIHVDLIGTLPLGEQFSVFGRVGAQYANTKNNFSGTGTLTPSVSNSNQYDTNMKLGVGLQYDLSPSVQLRGEAERYRINDGFNNRGDVNVFSLSLVFPIGRAASPRPMPVTYVAPPPAPAPTAPAPAVMATPAAAPVPVLVPAPVPAPVAQAPSRVQMSADSLFGFDKAGLSADGKATLDTFARDTRGIRFDMVSVEGHADRLGTAAYNQRLSEERADAVKGYLAQTPEMQGVTIRASGKGEGNPVTKPGDCVGAKATKALIACLQPDRRVDVEMVGVK